MNSLMKILLDTNFLMVPVQFNVDIYSQLGGTLYTLETCVGELKYLAKKKGKIGVQAKLALQIMKDRKVKILKSNNRGDTGILEKASTKKYTIATNDVELIEKLKQMKASVIRLRQKKIVKID